MKNNAFCGIGIWLALLLLFLTPVSAQQESFKRFNIENGLPQNYIYSISQTSQGALLVATGEGLVRYNGKKFTVVPCADSVLKNSFVTASHLHDSSQTYLGHYNGELSLFEDGKLKLMAPAEGFGSIRKIFSDQWGRLWFLNQQQQIRCLRGKNEWKTYTLDIQGAAMNDALLLTRDRMILATGSGVFLVGLSDGENVKLTSLAGLEYKNAIGVVPIQNNSYWIATEDDGIYLMELDTLSMGASHTEKVPLSDSLTRGIRSILKDSWGNVWIGRKNSGLSKLVFLNDHMEVHNYAVSGDELKLVNCIFQDREGTIWIGTYGNGLYQKTEKVLQHYRLDVYGGANDVRSLLETGHQTLLLGTTDGLVQVNYTKSGLNGLEFYTELLGKTVTTLARQSNGTVWMGTESYGVFVKPAGKAIRRDARLNLLNNKTINHIRIDGKDHVWISTNTEGVLVITENEIINYNTTSGLPHNQVIMTYSDKVDRTWYATFGGSMATSKNGKFVLHDASSGLDAYNINSVSSDNKGNVWIATYGKGLYSFNIVQFNKFGHNADLLSLYNYLLICDDFDNLWLGSRAGISRVDPSQGQVFNYKIPEAEVNTNAAIKTKNGDLWFGTNNGVYRHGFKSYIHNTAPPVTLLTHYLLGHDSTVVDTKSGEWDYTALPVSFVLEGLSLKNPENVRYRYKLDGYHGNWSEPQISNTIVIGNLREGTYTLHYQSTNNDGLWGSEDQFSFVIHPPFWRSWWFYISTAAIIIVLFVVIVKWRERALRESNRRLEETVRQRTATVIQQKNEIEEKNRDIQDSIDYASRIQQAILSDIDLKYSHVEEIFVLYIPKDVVSGDFYWLNETPESLIVAAADCTGHGVPGAFMSFIGESGLRRTVQDKKRERPDEILNALNQFVTRTLQQKQPDDIIKDGMDITVCTIDENGFQFAGAQNPLYWVHKGELQEIKGDKQPIGHVDVETKSFNNHELERNKGDMIYLFSDGYADQFGGPKDKKFMYKQFKDLLSEIHMLKADKQEQKLKEAFLDWKGDTEQVDDVLVIGIRL